MVNESLQYLNKAVELNPNYDDAMSYIALDYRLKAEMECGGKEADDARKKDLDMADQWGVKAMGARKANEAEKEKKAATGGVTCSSRMHSATVKASRVREAFLLGGEGLQEKDGKGCGKAAAALQSDCGSSSERNAMR